MSLIERANGFMNSPDKYFEWEKMKLVHDLKSKVEEMQKTLEWYADEDNHEWIDFESPVFEDQGERARQALKGESQ